MERLDPGQVEAAVDAKIRVMIQRYAPQITERARQILRSEIRHPERSTGRLANSIKYRVSDRSITIYAGAPYGLWVEEDTRPHIIRPRAKKALHWVGDDGAHRFAKYVWHPGTRGKRMLRRAMNEYRETIRMEMRKMVSEAIGETGR